MDRSKPKQSSSSPRRIPPTGTRPRRIPTPQRPQSQLAMSCPQPRYIHCWPWNQHYGKDTWPWSRDNNNANSSPKKRPVRSSSDTAANNRMTCSMYAVEKPSSTRIPYEGGVFGPSSHAAKRDFFVIHPDWVSEEVTCKKLGVNERKSRPIASAPPSFRRCRSAPPPRYRNPITWQ